MFLSLRGNHVMAIRFLVLIDPEAGTIPPFLEQILRRNTGVKLLYGCTGRPGVEGIVLFEAPSRTAAELFAKDLGNKTGTTAQLLTLTAFFSAKSEWA